VEQKVRLENTRLTEITPLEPPRAVKGMMPLPEEAAAVVARAREELRAVIHGRDNHRLVAIVGPCSIHEAAGAFEYAERLRRVAAATRDHLLIVMRTYFEKPRTTVGWKGLINDPHLDGSCDIAAGIALARRILIEINRMGLPCATEVLDPVIPQFIADAISWAAIGARTTESQTHRELASGLSMPVGFKNGTEGGLEGAVNAMISASHPHAFLGINADGLTSIIKTVGNPDRHIVLRGGSERPNYRSKDVARALALLGDGARGRRVLIDCSHDNSGKDHRRQSHVCDAVARQFEAGERRIMGIMLESNLLAGKQTWAPGASLIRGVSITDGCIAWAETETLLLELAERAARAAARWERLAHDAPTLCDDSAQNRRALR
jgi:3-deoxy-7-phosphoheptulonate synthase